VLDCLLDNGEQVVALFDPKYKGHLMHVPQRGTYDPDFEPTAKAMVAIGNNALRKNVVALTSHTFAKAVHRSAVVSSFAIIGEGSMILHRAVVQAQSNIGKHVIINTGAQVDHDGNIADYVHIAPGTVLCGCVQVGEGTMIGARAVILPGIKVGKWAMIGAGAVVTKDVPDYAVVVGNPARLIKYLNKA
jgi:sugar O-acyltransferase (sialic acid O-acetyltransferase NeuD family)